MRADLVPPPVPRPPSGVVRCRRCALHGCCLPLGLERDSLRAFNALIELPRPLKRGEVLVRQGESCNNLYVVRSGSLKQSVTQRGQQREQVLGFYLPGEIVGLDGIGEPRYYSRIAALEATFVCRLPLNRLESLAARCHTLRRQLYRYISRELRHDRRALGQLSGRTAEQRLAAFLLEIAERYRRRGCSPHRFHLAMSRSEIGSYLGLALETVSRTLGRFDEHGWTTVEGREVSIHQPEALAKVME